MYVKITDVLDMLDKQSQPGNIISELKGRLKPFATFSEEQIATNNIKVVAGEDLGALEMAQPEPEPKRSFNDQLNDVAELIGKKFRELDELGNLSAKILESKIEEDKLHKLASTRLKPSIHRRMQFYKNALGLSKDNPISDIIEMAIKSVDSKRGNLITYAGVELDLLFSIADAREISINPTHGAEIIYKRISDQYDEEASIDHEKVADLKKIATEAQYRISKRIFAGECPCGCGKKI